MKKLIIAIAVAASVVSIPAKAEPISAFVAGNAIMFGFGVLASEVTNNKEPHYSFRDGCKVQTITAPGGGYKTETYEHCKSLPKVYNGKAA